MLHFKKLDAIRGFAAIYVVMHHLLAHQESVPEIIKRLFFSFGQEAVILFFLLSGFVIYLSIHKTANSIDFRAYFIKRFRRIYFPFAVAVLLSILIYWSNGTLARSFSEVELVGNLLMVQDFSTLKPGTWVRPFLNNLPLWSLSYEWWFYMMFCPVFGYLKHQPYRIYLILLGSMLAYTSYNVFPNYASLMLTYLIIWWAGVESAVVFLRDRQFTYQNTRPILLALLLMTIFTTIPVWGVKNIQFGYYPFLMVRHFMTAFLAVLGGLLWYKIKLINFDRLLGAFATLAPISYSLYIFHYPLLFQWKPKFELGNPAILLGIKLLILVGLCYLVEIVLQPIVNRWLSADRKKLIPLP